MRVIITGAKGQLGKTIAIKKPKNLRIANEIFCFDKSEFDLLKPSECKKIIRDIRPNWLINCAAYTNVDKAEKNPEESNFINGFSLKDISESIKEIDSNLIQISTDYVFNGETNSPYKTTDKRNPINKYGEGKAIGEKFVEDILFKSTKSKIIRTSWLMSSFGNNFAKTIFKMLSSESELKIITDQVGSFTSTSTLADFIWTIILEEEKGFQTSNILHCTDSGICSWFDIAVAINKFVIKDKESNKCKIIPIQSKDFIREARRPSYSVLSCFNKGKLLFKEVPYWRDSLKEIVNKLIIDQKK